MSDDFGPLREELDEALPTWWQHRVPGSVLDDVLAVVAEQGDAIAADLSQVYDDQFMVTASVEALRGEWGPLFGVGNEDLAANAGNLLAYLQALALEDGSSDSLIRVLLGLLATPANDVGTELMFAADGSGLEFPADGSGLQFYESTTPLAALHFPDDGSPLTFPADGSPLTFPARGRLEIAQGFADYTLTVRVLEILAFDRGAFARAVERHRLSHLLPPTIVEVL